MEQAGTSELLDEELQAAHLRLLSKVTNSVHCFLLLYGKLLALCSA